MAPRLARLPAYQAATTQRMEVLYREGVVEADDLAFTASEDPTGASVKVDLQSQVWLASGIRVRV